MDEILGKSSFENVYQLVADDLLKSLEIMLVIPMNILISVTGTVANVFNVTILARLGFKQSMNYGTMALSITDLMVSSLQLTSEICLVLNNALEDSAIDFVALGGFPIGWMRYAGLYISGWITALIATERCFCVVFPFNVKHICSKPIYTLILIAIYSLYLGFVIPIIVIERLTWHQIPESTANISSVKYILTVVVDDTAIELQKLFDSVCVSGFAVLSQVILIISTLYMAYALRESSRVRTSFNTKLPLQDYKHRHSFLSLKEKRLIIVAVRLAVIILACSVPRYIAIALFATFPTLQAKENLTFSYFLFDVSDIFINANCFCTFFVYLSMNKNFKSIFFNLIHFK